MAAAEVEVVSAGRLANEGDFCVVGPCAAVGTTSHTQDDGVVAQTGGIENGVDAVDEVREVALGLGHCEAACWQRRAGHRVQAQRAEVEVVETEIGQQRADGGHVGVGHIGHNQIAVAGEAEGARVDGSDGGQRVLQRKAGCVGDAAVLHKDGVVVEARSSTHPAEAVAVAREGEGPGRLQRKAQTLRNLLAPPRQTVVVNGVLETRMLAVGAVAVIALHKHDGLGDSHGVFCCNEAQTRRQTRIRLGVVVCHAHAAADHDVVADNALRVVENGNQSEVVGNNIDVVLGRNGNRNLELARQIRSAVQRLAIGNRAGLCGAASNKLVVQPDLVVGGGAWQQMR
ncbi:hypothetical protein GGI11_004620 [Coemansia sp. RSA 2049]|nr:hypothetical protein GGI11_004620 [Coemansia sp. RSA 2049]